jgi:acetyl esterase/lipase
VKAALAAALLLAGAPALMDAQVLSTREAMALPSRPADHRIAWGTEPVQFGDLRLPAGPGPHPVVVLIHGGCWLAEYDLAYMGALADALRDAGIATWNIEYRRVGDAGGGWPGTMLDAGQAIDHLRVLAAIHSLDLNRVVLSGHSAGGHLALWAATRPRAAAPNPLRGGHPLPVDGVVAVSPVADLAASVSDATPICGRSAAQLLGGTPAEVPDRYALTSPSALLPLGIPYVIVSGVADQFVPAAHVSAFGAAAQRAGDRVRLELVPEAGHFEPVAPGTAAFASVLAAIRELVGVSAGR